MSFPQLPPKFRLPGGGCRTRYRTRADATADLFDYIEPFYNRKRMHLLLGYVSPKKFLETWLSNQHEKDLAT